MRPAPRILGPIAALGIGLVVGVLGAFLQAARSSLLGVAVPWGALLVLACLVAVVRGAVAWTGGRPAGWLAFAGWLAATILLASEGPWGDLVLSSGVRQFGYLLAGVVLGSAAASIPPAGPRLEGSPARAPEHRVAGRGDVEQESGGSDA